MRAHFFGNSSSSSFLHCNSTKDREPKILENTDLCNGFSSSFDSSNIANGGEVMREEKTAMGEKYVVNEFGDKIIPRTKRPDGSYRKPIKVKPGYIPLEEQRSYMTRVQESRLKVTVKGNSHPPGWSPLNTDVQIPQSKNKKNKKSITTFNAQTNLAVEDSANKVENKLIFELSDKMHENLNLNKKKETDKKKKKEAKKKDEEKQNKEENKNDMKNKEGIKENNLTCNLSTNAEVSKMIRSLHKKINEIKILEEKQKDGLKLTEDQINKINRKMEIEEEIKKLEILKSNKVN